MKYITFATLEATTVNCLLGIGVLLAFTVCTLQDASDANVPIFLIDNYDPQPIADASDYLELRLIALSDSVYRAIGGELGEVFVDEALQLAIFVDFGSGTISALSYAGELIWQLKPDGVTPRTYARASLVDYSPATHQLKIFDNGSRKIYYYSNGVFDREVDNRVDLLDVAYGRDSILLYYTEGLANYHITDDTLRYRLLVEYPDGRLSKVGRLDGRKTSIYEDKNEFNTYKGQIYLQRQFTDTIFEIKDAKMEVSSLVRFVRGNRTQAILDDVGLANPYDVMWEEDAPFFFQTIPINDLCYGIYRTGLYNYFFISDTTPESVVNSTLLQIDGKIVPTPERYWDGYYAGILSRAEYDHLQGLFQQGVELDESVFAQLIALREQVTDRGEAVLYLLKIKDKMK